jgi:hypothetical protein
MLDCSDDGDIAQPLRNFLIVQADPNVPVVVSPAAAVTTRLVLDVIPDGKYEPADVDTALIAALNMVFAWLYLRESHDAAARSSAQRCSQVRLAVAGVAEINGMTVNGAPTRRPHRRRARSSTSCRYQREASPRQRPGTPSTLLRRGSGSGWRSIATKTATRSIPRSCAA